MKQKIMICLVAVAAFFTFSTLHAQGWDKTFTTPLGDTLEAHSIVETNDSGFIFVGRTSLNNRFHFVITKTNSKGVLLWQHEFPSLLIWSGITLDPIIQIFKTSDSNFIVIGNEAMPNRYFGGLFVLKFDQNGVLLWKKNYNLPYYKSAISPDNNRIVITTAVNDIAGLSDYGALFHISTNGDSLKLLTFEYLEFRDVEFGGDNNIYTTLFDGQNPILRRVICKIGLNGNILWRIPEVYGKMHRGKDGRITVGGYYKFDYDGRIIFNKPEINGYDAFIERRNSNQLAVISDRDINNPSNENTSFLYFKDSLGNTINRRFFEQKPIQKLEPNKLITTSDGGFVKLGIARGYDSVRRANTVRPRLTKFTSDGLVYSSLIQGKTFIDSIPNCRLDIVEKGFSKRIILATKGTDTNWAITDSLGNYEMQIDTGNYLIKSVLPNQNWRFCTPSVSKQISATNAIDTVNFALQPLVNCPQMRISTSTQGLRRCFDNNYYQIRYTNEGTMAAQNAFITLKLDSLLEYVSATRRLSTRVGQTLTFNLGTVPIGFDDQFSVQVRVKCGDSTRLGQSLCTEARIFPDTICISAPNWSGANIVVSGRCDRDSVRFLVQNIGTGASSNLRRQIVEDEIVFLNGTIKVPASGSRMISVPANGKTWRLNVDQEPNNPLSNQPTAVVEGCRTSPNQPISTGFVNQFPTDDGSPTVDNVCAQIVGAFDPNDKEGLPLGYKNQRFINQNQAIDYRIRFQNTGNDTTFTVVLRDTLGDFLDISSLKVGASSHKYTWSIEGKNVLVFRFDNIKLVDSFRNAAASQGFVAFKINQRKDVALGSIINNQADIYFDYNAPIRTNKTVHTVGKDFIVSVLQINSNVKNVQINVFPNPFSAEATIDIQGFAKTGPLSIKSNFTLFDAFGRQLRREKFDGNQFVFERQNLGTGIYFFKIENGGQLIGTGKFLIQ